MSDTTQPQGSGEPQTWAPMVDVSGGEPAASGWAGWVVFAGVMMILLGAFQAIEGLVALFTRDYYHVRPGGLAVHVSYTTWGWVHLIIGIAAALTGLGLLAGNLVARVLGVVFAVASAVVNMAFAAASPAWSVIVIAVDVVVIFAIVTHGRELRSPTY
jgi:hypothetical protein